jgi:acyl dehydratase
MAIEHDREAVASQAAAAGLDTSDIDRWVGVPLAGAVMNQPVHVNDIRRWAQGMQNPNPLYYDEEYASASRFGEIIAPQSFVVCIDPGSGAAPAIQGRSPGTHMLFGGDEWWFYGPRIRQGDTIRQDRMLFDYRVVETSFAGPSVLSRGDTVYFNQRGEIVAKQRATAIRYRTDQAVGRKQYGNGETEPEWTEEALREFDEQKFAWVQSFRDLGHDRRLSVKTGEKLTRRLIGPHSATSLMREWSAFPWTVWGAFRPEDPDHTPPNPNASNEEASWLPRPDSPPHTARLDPSGAGDPVFKGRGRVHVDPGQARLVGLPRNYGFGACMGAWILDYVSNWVGEWGEIVHSDATYRTPSFTGDVALLDGEVVDVSLDDPRGHGQPIATIRAMMVNQRDEIMASAQIQVRLPSETLPREQS